MNIHNSIRSFRLHEIYAQHCSTKKKKEEKEEDEEKENNDWPNNFSITQNQSSKFK